MDRPNSKIDAVRLEVTIPRRESLRLSLAATASGLTIKDFVTRLIDRHTPQVPVEYTQLHSDN